MTINTGTKVRAEASGPMVRGPVMVFSRSIQDGDLVVIHADGIHMAQRDWLEKELHEWLARTVRPAAKVVVL